MFNKKRLTIALICGGLLGVVCVIGVGLRMGFVGNELFILATWYNRVIMGLLIGLAGGVVITNGRINFLLRGMLFGLLVSLALFLGTEFRDPLGFVAGIVYGVIIDYFATKYS